MDDRLLIYKIQRGQKELLNVVAEKYYDDVYRFCLYLTGHPEESYDLTQETFLKFINYVDHYRYRNLKGYLLTIARNLCMDFFRSRKDEPMEQELLENEGKEQTEPFLERSSLLEMLQQLPAMQREVLVLFYYDEMKIREIAALTGVSDSTVKSRLRQGVAKLKKKMMEDGYER